jgi:glycogen debranching enzyme
MSLTKGGTLYIYNALRVAVNYTARLCFAWSDSLEEAVEKANRLHRNAKKLMAESKKDYAITSRVKDSELRMAVKCATASINSLAMEIGGATGLYAGLPWFFQFWARDELVSLRAFMLERQHDFAKEVILRQLAGITKSGDLNNRVPGSGLECADGIGWLAVRLDELIDRLRKQGELYSCLNADTLMEIRARLEKAVEALLKSRTDNGFATNMALETWMDTSPTGTDDARAGARIEIQALRLRLYALMQKLCRLTGTSPEKFRRLEDELKKNVRESFLKDSMLADGVGDFTARPNVFIACYAYPNLLSKAEWEAVFENSLKKLWCSWGGLATIAKDSPLYQPHYTGEDNQSYHRGDSWFFANHLAAIAMLRVNRQKFMPYVKKIIEASTRDILEMGTVGHMSELSSGESQQPEGSPVQLWSAATFIELINEFTR